MVRYWSILSLLSILPLVYCNYPQYYQKPLVKDVLTPTNAERALQILKMATAGVNGRKSAKALEILRGQKAGNRIPQRRMASGRPIHNPAGYLQKQELPKQIVQKVAPRTPIQYNPRLLEAQQLLPTAYQPPKVAYESCPQQSNVNPFLPAASPISPFASTNFLPPTPCQSKGHFLRKIPIPPPTL